MLPPLPLWPQLSTWLQLLEGHGGYTRGCSTLTRGWPQYPSNPAPASSTSVCAAPGGVCRELHSCARPLNLANVCCAARPALCNCTPRCAGRGHPPPRPAGEPSQALQGRGEFASCAASPRPGPPHTAKLCRNLHSCRTFRGGQSTRTPPRRNLATEIRKAGDSCTHTHFFETSKLSMDSRKFVLPVSSVSVPCSQQLNMKIVLYLSRNTNLSK